MSGTVPSAATTRTRRGPAELALVGVTAIWDITFPVVKTALEGASPMAFAAVRMICAALLLALLYRRELPRLGALEWRAGAVTGLLMTGGFAFQTIGLSLTTASKSAFLTGLSVILVPFLVAVLLRRLPRSGSWAGAVLALSGLYLLAFFPANGHWQTAWQAPNAGDLLTLICALCFAGHIVAIGHYSPRVSFQALTVLLVAFCALFSTMAAAVLDWTRVEPAYFHASPGLWGAIAVTAVLATALAFSVQAWAQRSTPATHAALIFALEPVFALGAAVWWRHEQVSGAQLWGCGLILAAILLVEWMAARAGREEAAPTPICG